MDDLTVGSSAGAAVQKVPGTCWGKMELTSFSEKSGGAEVRAALSRAKHAGRCYCFYVEILSLIHI